MSLLREKTMIEIKLIYYICKKLDIKDITAL